MPAKQFRAQDIARYHGHFFFLRLDPGELRFLFPGHGFFRHGRVAQDIGDDFQTGPEIGLHDPRGNVDAIVAGIAADDAAHLFDLVGDLAGGARLRALEQHLGKQAREAVVRGGLRQQSGLEGDVEGNQRQAVVFPHEQTQAIGQLEFLDFARGHRSVGIFGRSQGARRIQRNDGEVLVEEIFGQHALDILRGHPLHGVEIVAREIEIARQQPVRAEVGGPPAHRGHCLKLMAERSLLRLGEFL